MRSHITESTYLVARQETVNVDEPQTEQRDEDVHQSQAGQGNEGILVHLIMDGECIKPTCVYDHKGHNITMEYSLPDIIESY